MESIPFNIFCKGTIILGIYQRKQEVFILYMLGPATMDELPEILLNVVIKDEGRFIYVNWKVAPQRSILTVVSG